MASTPAHVTPEVLRWARESLGYSIEDAAEKIGVPQDRLAAAEAGEHRLTMRQAERAAARYQRPLAVLFMPAPPREEPQEQQFRRLPDAPRPPWPPEMGVLARRIRERQQAAIELYELIDEPPPWRATAQALRGVDLELLPTQVRIALGITASAQTAWSDRAGYVPLREWLDAVERLGVLVMQDGSLEVERMRGFAAPHRAVPVIVANTNDDPRARAWTLIHELGHLLLADRGADLGTGVERWCDDFAGEVIMPEQWIRTRLEQLRHLRSLDAIDELALTFGVTPLAAAIRVARHGIWPDEVIDPVVEAIEARPGRDRSGGGDYYLLKITRLGPAFIRLVLEAVAAQTLPLSNAAGLLDVKVNHFSSLREKLETRGALE